MQLLIPLILIAAAVGLFGLWTNPQYQGLKGTQTQVASLDEALTTAKELKARRDELLSKRNTFSSENVQKLERVLPDNVDNIRFVIDINNIAARRSLSLRNVSLGSVSDGKQARGALAIGASGEAVGSAQISFSLTATYDDYLAFLQDLEHSLRIVDVEKINVKPVGTGNLYEFSMSIRTYWLR